MKGRAEMIKGPGDLPAHSRRTRECFHAIRDCAKPVIVAINGAALASGFGLPFAFTSQAWRMRDRA